MPLKRTVTEGVADFVKAHPQYAPSVLAVSQGPAVQAQMTNQSPGGRGFGGWAHSDPAQFPVGCNVQWTPVSNPPSQPMCARVLAGFLQSHFHDNLCTVLVEYGRAKFSLPNLGVGPRGGPGAGETRGFGHTRWLNGAVAKVLPTALDPLHG